MWKSVTIHSYTNVINLPLYVLNRSTVFIKQENMYFKDIKWKLLLLMQFENSRIIGCSKLLVILSYLYLDLPWGLVLTEFPTEIQVLLSFLWHIVKHASYSSNLSTGSQAGLCFSSPVSICLFNIQPLLTFLHRLPHEPEYAPFLW
jgi:hypothetical protein